MVSKVREYATEGQRLMAEHTLSLVEQSRRAGLSKQKISKYRSGQARPTGAALRAIERLGVPASAWSAPASARPRQAPVAPVDLPVVESIPEDVLRAEWPAAGGMPRACIVDNGPKNVAELASILDTISHAQPNDMPLVREAIVAGPLYGERLLDVVDSYHARCIEMLYEGLAVPGPELAAKVYEVAGVDPAAWARRAVAP